MGSIYYTVSGAPEAPPPPSFLLPVLQGNGGSNTGAEVTTTCAIGHTLLVFDTVSSATPPALISGYTNIGTATGTADLSTSVRAAWKTAAAANEAVPANSGGRRIVLWFSNCNTTTPIATSAAAGGNAMGIDVPGLTLSAEHVIVGFTQRLGPGPIPDFASPFTTPYVRQQNASTNIAKASSTVAAQASFGGQSQTATGTSEYVAVAIALQGAAA